VQPLAPPQLGELALATVELQFAQAAPQCVVSCVVSQPGVASQSRKPPAHDAKVQRPVPAPQPGVTT
jgi:hypothetical protein